MEESAAPLVIDDGDYQVRAESRVSVHPVLIIKSVRRIPQVLKAFEDIDFIDKVYLRNYPPSEISDVENGWLKDHFKDYTHVIISSDDITPSTKNIRQLLRDIICYDLPVLSGFCDRCVFDRVNDVGDPLCGNCFYEQPHPLINVTLTPVVYEPLDDNSYTFLTRKWADEHPEIRRVWWQGLACGVVRRDVWEKVPFRSMFNAVGGLMEDLALAVDCAKQKIPVFVDFRVYMRHYGTHHGPGHLLVGKEEKKIEFEPARKRSYHY